VVVIGGKEHEYAILDSGCARLTLVLDRYEKEFDSVQDVFELQVRSSLWPTSTSMPCGMLSDDIKQDATSNSTFY